MFNRLLIANRGEIACRIIKTARAMGIHTVAVYSSVDKNARHVCLADSAYWIGEAFAKESYLNIPHIIQAARASGAQAIHPGYGFLSENPTFAAACAEAGLIFIGPSIEAMTTMASKQVAKQQLEKTNVPLTPGYHGAEQSEAHLLIEAQKIGFPVLLKAANGGGGKGMRAVNNAEEFHEALAGAKRESLASFNDDVMIIEKLVLNPRHIEVQIMADNFGTVVHLFERDCSIQRRHQKIIEEAPAPNLPDAMRKKIADAACEVASSINYRGAGTVEFLVDGEQFYFMEMNTRLQVEHPVTEMITGLDLVAWQFKIAANEPLPLSQSEIKLNGHAIECRIYAEDPYHEFIPSVGVLHFLKEPKGQGLRVDTGVVKNSAITRYYDPMIAKLIVHGEDRDDALQRLVAALDQYHIGGVKTNLPFLKAIGRHPQFEKAVFSTNFLTNETIKLNDPDLKLAVLMSAGFDYLHLIAQIKDPLLKDTFAWQANTKRHWTWRYEYAEESIELQITPISSNQLSLIFQGTEYFIKAQLNEEELRIELHQQIHKVFFENQYDHLTLYTDAGPISLNRLFWASSESQSLGHKGQLTAPMPATVVAILKKPGDLIKAGERLIVLEAMKMEHTVHAPIDGVLTTIFYSVGSQVNEGDELLSLRELN